MVWSKNYYVYFVTNIHKTVLYVGVTNNLTRRTYEHSKGLIDGFTKKYNCHYLVYYEHFTRIDYAINREKQIKKWRRSKKDELITEFNPEWRFLNDDVLNN
ncbi:MAG: GIY-YIG nuclease family protein [Bacteroidales bacterium]|jgi:putative endonuclease|nr:GIY-YIG nuclease family protein [Bacteroidales bacterium]